MSREIACGVLALALAVVYYAAAAALPTSLLSDEVGADGVPKLLAIGLAVLGVLQLGRVALTRSAAAPAAQGVYPHMRAAGLLGLGVASIVLTPYIGYPVAMAALVFFVAVYAGMRPTFHLAAVSAAGALILWVTFVKLLGVAMPVGLWRWFARVIGGG